MYLRKQSVAYPIVFVALLVALAGVVQADPALKKERNLLQKVVEDRFEIGLRSTYFGLIEDSREPPDSFLGSIDMLDPDDTLDPLPYLNIKFLPWLGVELGWFEATVKTVKSFDGNTDGDFYMRGPTVMLWVRYPNRTIFTPFIGAGAVFIDPEFRPDPVFFNGFGGDTWEDAVNNYNQWQAEGAPEWPNYGYRRNIETEEDIVAFLGAAGFTVRIARYCRLDCSVRYVPYTVVTHFYLSRYGETFQDSGDFDIPMDMWEAQAGFAVPF